MNAYKVTLIKKLEDYKFDNNEYKEKYIRGRQVRYLSENYVGTLWDCAPDDFEGNICEYAVNMDKESWEKFLKKIDVLPRDLLMLSSIDIDKKLDLQFKYDEKEMEEHIGTDVCEKILQCAEKYEKFDQSDDTIILNAIYYLIHSKDIGTFVYNLPILYDGVNTDEIIDGFANLILKIVKRWKDFTDDIYRCEEEKMVKFGLTPQQLLNRTEKFQRLFERQIKVFDNKMLELVQKEKFGTYQLKKEEAQDFLAVVVKTVFTHERIWESVLAPENILDEMFKKDIIKIFQNTDTEKYDEMFHNYFGCSYRELSLKGIGRDVFEKLFNHAIFQRLVVFLLSTFVYDGRPIPNLFRLENKVRVETEYEFCIRKDIRDIFTEIADIEDILDGTKVLPGMLYEVKDTLENNLKICNVGKNRNVSDIELGIVSGEQNDEFLIYDKQTKDVVCRLSDSKLYEIKHQIMKNAACYKNGKGNKSHYTNEEIILWKEKRLSGKVLNRVNRLYQERMLLQPVIENTMKGKSKNKQFSYIFNETQSLRENLPMAQSYIIEKKSGLYLTWAIFMGTIRFRRLSQKRKEDVIVLKKVVELTKALAVIQNADIRLQIAEAVMEKLQSWVQDMKIDLENIFDVAIEEIVMWVKNYNERYNFVYTTLICEFSSEPKEGESRKNRIDYLMDIEYKLSDTYMKYSIELEDVFKREKDQSRYKNDLFQSEIEKLLTGGKDTSQYKWFHAIFEAVHD